MAAASSGDPSSKRQRPEPQDRPPRDGYGVYVYPNSFFRYEGEWKGGKKHGRGKLLFKDGSYYEGDFEAGEISGEGRRHWAASGNTYSGHFVLGEPHGRGSITYRAGGWYEGEFRHGMREGLGLLQDSLGQLYRGSFHENRRHGRGHMAFQNGDSYEGDWVRDQQQGHGMLRCADGSVYQGQWYCGVLSGLGSLAHCSGLTYHGQWVNGHPVEQAVRMVVLGPRLLTLRPDATFSLQVQLQQNSGDTAGGEDGRLLRVSAGVRYVQLPAYSTVSFFRVHGDPLDTLIQTPFGFQCIPYPLGSPAAGDPEPSTDQEDLPPALALGSRQGSTPCPLLGDIRQKRPWAAGDTEGWRLLQEPGWNSSWTPVRDKAGWWDLSYLSLSWEPPGGHDLGSRARAGGPPALPGSHGAFVLILWKPPCAPHQQKHGTASGHGTAVPNSTTSAWAPPQPGTTLCRSSTAPLRRWQDRTPRAQPRDAPGEYVIKVEDVTSPPFLGHTLPPAFQHLLVSAPEGQQGPPQTPPQRLLSASQEDGLDRPA
ncbi:MORN repeat-containing protein 1 [Sorex fumeus]|uniref:MORN repeat-containing protein 1 n=1 Tax=Sorex fumeus TaxID=62283 RepID=UPI0024AD75BD|nr:MORN repeat-containing protein 1 [Sorex fumeus]